MVNKVTTEVSLAFVGVTALALLNSLTDKLFKFVFTDMFVNKSFLKLFLFAKSLNFKQSASYDT